MSRSRAAGAKPKRRRKKDLTGAPKGAPLDTQGRVRRPLGGRFYILREQCPLCEHSFWVNLRVAGAQIVADVVASSSLALPHGVERDTMSFVPTATTVGHGVIGAIPVRPSPSGAPAGDDDDAQTTLFSP